MVSATPKGENQAIDQVGDSETTSLIRKFMQQNDIIDIKIRMLSIQELKSIQGFPNEFKLERPQFPADRS